MSAAAHMMPAPRIALIAASDLNRHTLQNLLLEAGFEVAWSGLPAALNAGLPCVDAWLVDSAELAVDAVVERVLEFSDAPLLVNEPIPSLSAFDSYKRWRRRLLDKLDEVAVPQTEGVAGDNREPWAVWVLAASTGGPEAVRQFLAALPADLPIALIYAQHIDPQFDAMLAGGLGRYGWPAQLCRGETRLVPGRLLLVPAERQLRLLPFGRVVATRQPWPGPYRPGIDQVAAQVARQYRQRAGLIVFSGLCNDGAVGARVMQACGGRVWVQSPDGCVSPAMPEAALATGCVELEGSPAELAQALALRYAGSGPASESV